MPTMMIITFFNIRMFYLYSFILDTLLAGTNVPLIKQHIFLMIPCTIWHEKMRFPLQSKKS